MLISLCPAAYAQEDAARAAEAINYSVWQEYADAQGMKIDVKETVLSLVKMGGWDISGMLKVVSDSAEERLNDAVMLVAMLAVPVLLCALIGQFASRGNDCTTVKILKTTCTLYKSEFYGV